MIIFSGWLCIALFQVLLLESVYQRFVTMAEELGETVPASFESRRSTFKEKLEKDLADVYEFYQPMNRDIHERQMLLIPVKFRNKLIADQYFNQENYQPLISTRTIFVEISSTQGSKSTTI